MKQRIVIELPLHGEDCRSEILGICTTADGVTAVSFEREGRERVVIKGENVDAARITKCLRKKVTKQAKLVSVAMDD